MGIINQLKISKDVIVLDDLKNNFIKRILYETSGYDTIVLGFDPYDDDPDNILAKLKQRSWDSRHREQIQYKLSPKTIIKDINL